MNISATKKECLISVQIFLRNTLSVNLKAGPLTFIPEIRYENAKDEIYVKNEGEGTKKHFHRFARSSL